MLDQACRNALRRVVQRLREILNRDLAETLEGAYGIHRSGQFEPLAALPALDAQRERDLSAVGLRQAERETVGKIQRHVNPPMPSMAPQPR